jgi:hypothetical protein
VAVTIRVDDAIDDVVRHFEVGLRKDSPGEPWKLLGDLKQHLSDEV